MDQQRPVDQGSSLEERSRTLFQDSVDGLNYATRSRLTQARNAALEAVPVKQHLRLFHGRWAPAAGLSAAAVLGVALWFGALGHYGVNTGDGLANLEDLEIVAASDETPGDAMEMLQEDIAFYDFAEKVDNVEPAV